MGYWGMARDFSGVVQPGCRGVARELQSGCRVVMDRAAGTGHSEWWPLVALGDRLCVSDCLRVPC